MLGEYLGGDHPVEHGLTARPRESVASLGRRFGGQDNTAIVKPRGPAQCHSWTARRRIVVVESEVMEVRGSDVDEL